MTGHPGGEPEWEAATPYAGPPSYQPAPYPSPPQPPGPPPGYGQPGYGPPGYGPPPGYAPPPGYGWGGPPWGWNPARPPGPRRPGTSIAAAVVTFTLALLTLVGTVYAAAFSALLTIAHRPDGGLGSWTPFAQLAVVVALATGGVLVLGGRRTVLLVAAGAELLLAVWWFAVLADVAPAGLSGQTVVLPLLFGVLAAVAAGLTCTPSARAWARDQEGRRAAAGSGGGRGGQVPAGS